MNNIGLSNCFDMHTVWKLFPDLYCIKKTINRAGISNNLQLYVPLRKASSVSKQSRTINSELMLAQPTRR